MKIYTRTGDDGTTGLRGGTRVAKDSARIDAYGTLDELNATLGAARARLADGDLDAVLGQVQAELFVLGAELASLALKPGETTIGAGEVRRLEEEIDRFETELEPLRSFILPGGSEAAAALHLSRTVCRRAERALLHLSRDAEVRPEALIYLNRLSDHLFVLARAANRRAGKADVPWQPAARSAPGGMA